MNNDIHLDDMLMFSRVAAQKGFNAASRQFGMSKQTISRRIAMLEASLGVKLIERNTRAFELTPEGRSYFDDCQRILKEVQQANLRVKDARHCKEAPLRVVLPGALNHKSTLEMFKLFCHRNPRIRLYLFEHAEACAADAIDVQIGLACSPEAASKFTPCGYATFGAFASPDYVSKFLASDAEVSHHFIISDEDIQPDYLQQNSDPAIALRVRNFYQALQASIAGYGVSFLPIGLTRASVQARHLQLLNFPFSTKQFPVIAHLNQQNKSCAASVFLDHLKQHISHNQIWDGIHLAALQQNEEAQQENFAV